MIRGLWLVARVVFAAVVAALLVCVLLIATDTPVAPRNDVAAFVTWLDSTVPDGMATYGIDASVIGIVHDGRLVHLQGYGHADAAHQVPVTPDTVFNVASVSKPMAAWGVMHLVETGRIDLDRPVSDYLTRWSLPASPYDDSGVTVRRLLSHTAGIANVGGGYEGYGPDETPQTLVASLAAASDAGNEAARLIAEPGQSHLYSGAGYEILQLLVEEVSGQDFSSYMQDAVFAPLGLESSSYAPDAALLGRATIVRGLDEAVAPPRLFTAQAAAGLYTTGADLTRWLMTSMALERGEASGAVLTPETFATMITPQPEADGWLANGLGYSIAPKILSDGAEVFHTGRCLPGWTALVSFLPGTGNGIVMLTNAPGGMALEHEIRSAWMVWESGNAATFGLRLQKAVNLFKPVLSLFVSGGL